MSLDKRKRIAQLEQQALRRKVERMIAAEGLDLDPGEVLAEAERLARLIVYDGYTMEEVMRQVSEETGIPYDKLLSKQDRLAAQLD